ncbi:PstS family phosphate ABC transporter substrate-binding protein [Spirosoma arcticum]
MWTIKAVRNAVEHRLRSPGYVLLLGLALVDCRSNPANPDTIHIDGSSTVFPLTEAVVEEYGKQNVDQKITVGISGTGGGFQKFCRDEAQIINASRSITEPERTRCGQNNVRFLSVEVAYDGLAIVVNPANTWVTSITVAELRRLWEPAAQARITRWNQLRPNWPDAEIHLFGAGVASGTYDYFTEAIVGKAHASRGDYTASENDNVLVQGVATDRFALGFFGLAYVEENKARLKVVAVDDGNDQNGKGPVLPTVETVRNKTYAPLTRPLFLYINQGAARQPVVRTFVTYYLDHIAQLAQEAGYVPLSRSESNQQRARFEQFAGLPTPPVP